MDFLHIGCNHAHHRIPSSPSQLSKEEQTAETALIQRKFKSALGLCSVFLILELLGGYFSHSLAILSDASHMGMDLASIALSLAASHLSSYENRSVFSFGLGRLESLAAFLSMLSLAGVTVYLIVLAMIRLVTPPVAPINGRVMVIVASFGILVNLGLAYVLGEHHHHHHGPGSVTTTNDEEEGQIELGNPNDASNDDASNEVNTLLQDDEEEPSGWNLFSALPQNINLRATYLHVLGDLLQSIGVGLAGTLIWLFPPCAFLVDPLSTILFGTVVILGTLPTLKASLSVLLLQVPTYVDYSKVHEELEQLQGVRRIENLRIFLIRDDQAALTVRVYADNAKHPSDADELLRNIQQLATKHGVMEATAQIHTKDPQQRRKLRLAMGALELNTGVCMPCL